MSFQAFVFYVLSAILLFAGVRVITAKNPVHAALFLVLAFFTASGHWLLLQSEFLSISLVLVYVGAVMVLFLFVVMMLDINLEKLREGFWSHFPLAGTVGVIIALEMAWVLTRGFNLREAAPLSEAAVKMGNTKMLGIEMYTQYLYPLQVAAMILLVGMIAAIALTLRRRKDTKAQSVAEQLKARKADRLRIVKIDAVQDLPAASADASKGQA